MGPVDVVIVGSGPAGLGVAGELKRRGLEAVVLERAEAIAARWRSRYAGLRLNTFRAYSHLPGSPLPREAGRYASLETFVAYLEDYARSRSLDVRPGVEAQRVERDRAGGWRVISSGGELSCRNVVGGRGLGWRAQSPRMGQQRGLREPTAPHLAAQRSSRVHRGACPGRRGRQQRNRSRRAARPGRGASHRLDAHPAERLSERLARAPAGADGVARRAPPGAVRRPRR